MCGEALKSKLAFRGAHMKYTPKFLRGMLLSMIRKMGEHPEQYVRQPGRDFTRSRTLTFETVISLLLTMSENSIGKILIGQFQNSEKHRRLRPLSSSVISCCPRRWKRCFTASRSCLARKKPFMAAACLEDPASYRPGSTAGTSGT